MRFDLQRPDCDTAMESLWEFIDAELAPGVARVIGAHLETCERCGPRVRASLAFKRAIRVAECRVRAPLRLRVRVMLIEARQ